MCHNPAAQIRLKATGQQEYAVVKAALDPFLVALHEQAGFAFVVGKTEKDEKHRSAPVALSSAASSIPQAISVCTFHICIIRPKEIPYRIAESVRRSAP